MRIHIAADHAGFKLKEHTAGKLREEGHEVTDHGAHSYDPVDDYSPMCIACGEAVVVDPSNLGVIIGGSGNGEQIAMNRVRGVRMTFAWSLETARLGREYNDTSIVAIGACQHGHKEAFSLVKLFISTPFSRGERHQRYIDLVARHGFSER